MKVDIHKFSFAEMTSNSCGKTSPSIIAALCLIIPTGCAGFIIAVTGHHSECAIHALGVIGVGAGLLGIRRFTPDKKLANQDDKPHEDGR